ncbi:MAG: hypothetical protein EOO68_38615 [Moraxellaceae bacterium]|nr:MAG: hypothetical protein EOO68_38615 [Moraxellaceae bacterium]
MFSVSALADAQGDRKKFIDQLISQGIFQKIDVAGDLPHVWVTPVFKSLDFQTKANCVSVVYGYYREVNRDYNVLVILDGATEKRIGEYSKDDGGLKLD